MFTCYVNLRSHKLFNIKKIFLMQSFFRPFNIVQSFFRPFNIVVSVFATTFPSPEPGHCGLGVVGDQRKCNDMMFTTVCLIFWFDIVVAVVVVV